MNMNQHQRRRAWTIAKAHTRTVGDSVTGFIEWCDGLVTKGPADNPGIAYLLNVAKSEKKFTGNRNSRRLAGTT